MDKVLVNVNPWDLWKGSFSLRCIDFRCYGQQRFSFVDVWEKATARWRLLARQVRISPKLHRNRERIQLYVPWHLMWALHTNSTMTSLYLKESCWTLLLQNFMLNKCLKAFSADLCSYTTYDKTTELVQQYICSTSVSGGWPIKCTPHHHWSLQTHNHVCSCITSVSLILNCKQRCW